MPYATPTRYERVGRGESSAVIVAMGLALAVAGIVQALETSVSQPVVAFELFISLLVPTGLATGGYWLASRNVSPDRRWRAATRVSIGIVVACGLAAWLTVYVALEGGTVRDPLSLTTTLAAVGGATGFVTAVRDPNDAGTIGSTDSTEIADGTDRDSPVEADADATAASNAAAQSPSTADAPAVPAMERPTAAAAAATVTSVTAAAGGTAVDGPTVSDSERGDGSATADAPALPEPSTSPATTARARPEPAVWRHTDPDGRTAAPASPAVPDSKPAPGPASGSNSDPHGEYPDSSPHGEFRGFDDARTVDDAAVPAPEPGVETVAAVPATAESVLEVLRSERSRIALAVLYHEWNGDERSVDALARAVSYHTDADADAVATALRHATLPELDEIRAVDWDPYADRVAAAEHAIFEEGVREASVLLESFEPGTR